ncbi:hypothetical protein C0991_007835 [Blastosporella zonata]|nr:hypothetical protein C0991_007835 [Blastosporella zonata]
MFVLNITTQITATALIACRLYRAFYPSPVLERARYMSIVWLFVECGALYTLAAIIQLILYLLKMNAGVILELAMAQLSAIAPGWIVIRVALGLSSECDTSRQEVLMLTTFCAAASITIPSQSDKKGYVDTFGSTIAREEPPERQASGSYFPPTPV